MEYLLANNEEAVHYSIYIQSTSQTDDEFPITWANEKAAIQSAGFLQSFRLDNSRESLVSEDGIQIREHCLVGECKPSLSDYLTEWLVDQLSHTNIKIKEILSHECENIPIFTPTYHQHNHGTDSDRRKCALDVLVVNSLTPTEVCILFAKQGMGVIKNCITDNSSMAAIITTVRVYITGIMSVVSARQTTDSRDRIKYREVMQRDNGRFDINLSVASEMVEFTRYASPQTQDCIGDLLLPRAPWLSTIDACFDGTPYDLCQAGVVVSTGGCANAQYWHADGHEGIAPRQAICLFIPLCTLSETTGYTSFWPGSQHYRQSQLLEHNLPSKMPPGAIFKGDVEFGDCIVYDFKTIHRGEANKMPEGEIRPIVYLLYGVKGYCDPNFNPNSIYDAM